MTLRNPYLEEFLSTGPDHDADCRQKLCLTYAWAVPTTEAIAAIAPFAPIVEICAGAGYWAWLVRQFGVEIIAFDKEPIPLQNSQHRSTAEQRFTTVAQGDEQRVQDYPEHT